jgi:alpha-galactosidase
MRWGLTRPACSRIATRAPVQLPPLYLRGLDPDASYTVEVFADPRSGRGWMRAGLHLKLGDFQSTLRQIRGVSS